MTYYKALAARLSRCGWKITDESHGGNIWPHYFRYDHPADTSRDSRNTIEIYCFSNKDGMPGRIGKLFQGGRPCRV